MMEESFQKADSHNLPTVDVVMVSDFLTECKNLNQPQTSIKAKHAKWGQERPHISSGPFLGKYVFSNWHLHWGPTDMEGSEHSIDGAKYPAEMHVVTFKSCYLTQEAALKEQDGCATLVYFFKLQDAPNPAFQTIVDALLDIPKAGTSKKVEPTIITNLVRKFTSDYFMYWGSVSTEKCVHYILWIITRTPIGASADQIDSLRFIFDEKGDPLTRNFRNVNTHKRSVFHVNPSSSKYSTLLPLSYAPPDVVQLFRCESPGRKEVNIKNNNVSISQVSVNSSQKKNQLEETGQKIDLNKYIFQTVVINEEDPDISQDLLTSLSNDKLGDEDRGNLEKYIYASLSKKKLGDEDRGNLEKYIYASLSKKKLEEKDRANLEKYIYAPLSTNKLADKDRESLEKYIFAF